MSPVFTNLYVDISPEFQELCSQSFPSLCRRPPFSCLMEKVCDMTGAVFVQGGQPRLAGSWQAIETVHGLLSGLTLYFNIMSDISVEMQGKLGNIHPTQKCERDNRQMYTRNSLCSPREETTLDTASDPPSSMRTCTRRGSFDHDDPPDQEVEHGHNRAEKQSTHENDGTDDGQYRDVHVITLTETESDSDDKRNYPNDQCDTGANNRSSPVTVLWPTASTQNQVEQEEYLGSVINRTFPFDASTGVANVGSPPKGMGPQNRSNNQGDDSETYSCTECLYVTRSSRNFEHHRVRIHLRPWKCGRCNKGFGLQKDLQRHYKSLRSCNVYKRPVREPLGQQKPNSKPAVIITNTVGHVSHSSGTADDMDSYGSPYASLHTESETSSLKTSGSSQIQIIDTINMPQEPHHTQQTKMLTVIKEEPVDHDNSMDVSNMESYDEDVPMDNHHNSVKTSTHVGLDQNFTLFMKQEQNATEGESLMDNCGDSNFGHQNRYTGAVAMASRSGTDVTRPHEPSDCVHTSASLLDSPNVDLILGKSDSPRFDEPQWPVAGIGGHPQAQKLVAMAIQTARDDSEIPLYLCSSCDYKADNVKKVDDHIHRVHYRTFQCSKCPALFGLQKDLTRHYRKTHKMFIERQRRGRKSNGQWSNVV